MRSHLPTNFYSTLITTYFNAFALGAGAVKSTIKQIARRIKILGEQWNLKNFPQVLKPRYAYLNLNFA
jgi:hypothetical protein